jgi:hypothetical protein
LATATIFAVGVEVGVLVLGALVPVDAALGVDVEPATGDFAGPIAEVAVAVAGALPGLGASVLVAAGAGVLVAAFGAGVLVAADAFGWVGRAGAAGAAVTAGFAGAAVGVGGPAKVGLMPQPTRRRLTIRATVTVLADRLLSASLIAHDLGPKPVFPTILISPPLVLRGRRASSALRRPAYEPNSTFVAQCITPSV